MKRLLLTVVILNPYEGLNYDEINVYEISEQCHEKCIEVHEPEIEAESWGDYLSHKYESPHETKGLEL